MAVGAVGETVNDDILTERAGRNIKQMARPDDGHHQIYVSQWVTSVTPFKQRGCLGDLR